MKLRAGVALVILTILACTLLAANQHKPFEMIIDPQSPGVWPKYAGLTLPPRASGYFQAYEVALPPERLRGSAAADGALFTDQETIDALCGGRNLFVACSEVGGGSMILPNPCQARFAGESFAAVACHEKGHLLGWPTYHGE